MSNYQSYNIGEFSSLPSREQLDIPFFEEEGWFIDETVWDQFTREAYWGQTYYKEQLRRLELRNQIRNLIRGTRLEAPAKTSSSAVPIVPVTGIAPEPIRRVALPRVESVVSLKKAFSLDKDKIQRKISETEQVSDLLETIFEEEKPSPSAVVYRYVPAQNTTFNNLDSAHFVLINFLRKKPLWSRTEIEAVANPLGLMASGTLERLNEMALDAVEELVFEGEDPIEVNLKLLEELMK